MMAGRSDPKEVVSSRTQFHRNPSSKAGRQQVLRTSSLLGIGLQDPLEDVVAAQTPDRIVVDGVHTGAEGLLLQLCHPANHQPASHTQQQQQQQLQHSPGPGVFPGWRLTGPRARLRFWRDSHSRQSSVSVRRPTLSPLMLVSSTYTPLL